MNVRFLGCVLLCCASAVALADPEHQRISSERAAANSKLADQESECATRFIVATCVEDARTGHRDAIKKLRLQELQLDEGRRRAAAEARRKAIADKAQAQQARASDAAPDEPRVRVRPAPQPAPAAPNRVDESLALHPPGAGAPAANRGAVEQLSQQKFESRRRHAETHRDAVTRRNAERAAKGKVAAPLPPGGASAPR